MQAAFNFFGFAWVGLVLKWPITFGDMQHSHPHTPAEDYISRPNQYLNVAMTALAVDLFEPLWLLIMYCRNKGRARPATNCAYGCCTSFFLLYSFLCLLFVGALCSIAVPIAVSSKPAIVYEPPSPPLVPGVPLPPSPPVIHETIFQLGDLIVFFATVFVIGLIKLISYWYGVPQSILAWEYRRLYA